MKKILYALVMLATLSIISCKQEPQEEVPTLTVALSAAALEEATFSVSSENATEAAYMLLAEGENKTAEQIVAEGTSIDLKATSFTVPSLAVATDYRLVAAAKNVTLYSEVATVEFTTLDYNEPTISLELASVSEYEASFNFSSTDATGASYMVIEGTEVEATAEVIKAMGVSVDLTAESFTVADLSDGTEYTLAAVTYNETKYSQVATVSFTTVEAGITFAVEPVSATAGTVVFNISPSDITASFMLQVLPKEAADQYTDEALVNELKDYYGEYISSYCYSGNVQGTASGLWPNSEYVVMLYALDPATGDALSKVSRTSVYTTEVTPLDLTFDITLENIEYTTAHIRIEPSNNTDKFVWLYGPKSNFPDCTTGEEIAEAYVRKEKGYLDSAPWGTYTGVQDYTMSLMPGTEHFLVVFGYNEGIATEVSSEFFTTKSGGDKNDLTAEFSATDVGPFNATISIDVNDDYVYYMWGCVPTEIFDPELMKEEVAMYIQEYYEMYQSFDPTISMADIIDMMAWMGDTNYTDTELAENTSYTVYAVAVDVEGNLADNVYYHENLFTTTEYKVSDAKVDIVDYHVFKVDDAIAAGIPITGLESAAGRALVWVGYEFNESAAAGVYTSLSFDYSNPDSYSDFDLLHGYTWMTWYDIKVPYTLYAADWDWDYTYLAAGKDAEGTYGPVSRLYTSYLSADNVSDISILEELLAANSTSTASRSISKPVLAEKASDSLVKNRNRIYTNDKAKTEKASVKKETKREVKSEKVKNMFNIDITCKSL